MAETDILLTTGLDTKDAYKDAEHLQKEIEGIFKSRKGVQSATLTSIEIQMKKLSQQSKELRTSMKEMLDIHADYSDVTSQFSSLYNEIQALENKMLDLSTPMSDEELDKIQNEITNLYNEMTPLLSQMKELEQFQVPTEEFAALEEQYKNLMSEVEKGNIKYSKAQQELDKLEKEMNKMRMAGTAMVAPESLEEFQNYQTKLDSVNDKIKQLIIRHNEAGSSGTKSFSRLNNVLNGLKAAVNKVVTGFKKLLGYFIGIKRTTSGPSNPFKALMRNLLRFGLGLASIYMLVNKLRAAVKEGFSNLYKDNKAFKKSVDSLKGSLTTFKNSLAAAFQPIVSVAIPHIQKLVDWMTQLMQQVAKFSAAITGQKYYMKAIKQTGDAAEKAQKQLAGFDKLNVLNSENGAGGTMFEEVPLEGAEELLQKIKDTFSLDGLYNLGKTFAEKINGFLDSIPWNSIKQKASEIGKKLATFINGIADNFHFDTLGATLAEGFNSLFNFLYNFVSTLHWKTIGEGIGEALTSFADTLNVETIAQTIAGYINGLGEFISGFLNKSDFVLIGTKIGQFLDELFTGGEDGEGGIDWKALGGTLHLAFIKLCDMVIAGLGEIHWEDIGKKIGELLKEFFEGEPNPFKKLAEVFWTVLGSAFDLMKGVFNADPIAGLIVGSIVAVITASKVLPIVNAIVTLVTGASSTTILEGAGITAGTAIGGGLMEGLKTALTGVAGFIAGQTAGAGAGAWLTKKTGGTDEQVGWWESFIGHPIKMAQTEVKVFSEELKGMDVYLNEAGELTVNLTDMYEDMRDRGLAPTANTLNTLNEYFQDGGETAEMIKSEFYTLNEALGDFAYQNELLDKSPFYVKTLHDYVSGSIGKETLEFYAEMEGQSKTLEADLYRIQNGVVDLGTVTSNATAGVVESVEQVGTAYSNTSSTIVSSQETQQRALQASKDASSEYAQRTTEGLNTVYNKFTEVSDGYSNTIGTILQDNVGFKSSFKDTMSSIISTASSQTNTMSTLFSSLRSNLKTAFNGIISGSESMSNGVADGINGVANSLNSMSFTLPDWLPGVGGKSLNFSIPRVSKISIPKLAQGAVIPANKEFLAVLGDQKQGTNVEAPLDTIKQAFAEVMMQIGGTSDNSDIVINIDGDEVFRVVRDKDRIFKKSTGKSAFA